MVVWRELWISRLSKEEYRKHPQTESPGVVAHHGMDTALDEFEPTLLGVLPNIFRDHMAISGRTNVTGLVSAISKLVVTRRKENLN